MRGEVTGITITARTAELLRRERDALRVVSRARRDHALRKLARDRCAILLYAPRSLNEKIGCRSSRFSSSRLPRPARKRRRGLERRLDRDVVDARLEDALEVIVARARG
jgi:hypothetical protein